MSKMSNIFSESIVAQSLEDTRSLAHHLALALRVGDIVLLTGDLGAGKTAFARFIIQALCGCNMIVPSPTFTLVQAYEGENFPIWHFDFYRLESADGIWDLGYTDGLSERISLIEWPDKMGGYQPQNVIEVAIQALDDVHRSFCLKDKR